MAVQYGKFEMPSKIQLDENVSTSTYGRFIASPFSRGYGHTIANTLRRVLLTSLEAPAIVSVRIDGVPHEFMAVEGIIEDMTNVLLNFKGALLRKLPADESSKLQHRIITVTLDVTQEELDQNGGQKIVALKDLMKEGIFELVNPDHRLFTVTKPMKKQIDMRVAIGRGYVPSERHEIVDKATDDILLDAIYTPVRKVAYFVEHTRVGQDTDYDRLILEIFTDGRVTPQEALGFASQIAKHHFDVFANVEEQKLKFESDLDGSSSDDSELLEKLCKKIDEIELSVRSTNCLQGANIETLAELVRIPERKMLEFRNFGKKSLNEIKAKLYEMHLSLGMDLTKFGILHNMPREVVKEKVKQLAEQLNKS